MEVLIIILLIVVILLLQRHRLKQEDDMRLLSERLRQLSERVSDAQLRGSDRATTQQSEDRPAAPRPARPSTPSWPKEEEQQPPLPQAEPRPLPQFRPATPSPQEPAVPEMTQRPQFPLPPKKEAPHERFLREHPDLEKFIGENLVNKIGIAILVLGIAFFVKYAIDREWIAEAGRVAIGVGCGALLIGLAHFLRRSYTAFSAVLAGGGIAVLYTTIAFAFHQYGLMSQPLAFGLMVVITAFAVLLSLLYNSRALAVIATLGGFATPFLVSNGSGNYVALFTYLAILNAGILAAAFFRRWPLLQSIAFACTVLITGSWLMQLHGWLPGSGATRVNYPLALALITLNYALFLGSTLVFPLRFRRPFQAGDLGLLLLLTAAYYAAGMTLLSHVENGRYQGLFTLLSGVTDLALAIWCFRRRGTDRKLLYVLIGLTLTFATLAVPVQLHGHAITLFWCAEFVLLYWLFQRSGIGLFRIGSWILMALASISLGMDWLFCPSTAGGLTLLFDGMRGAVTNAVALAAFTAYYFLLQRKDAPAAAETETHRIAMGWVTGIAALAILYCSLLSGVNLYFYKLPNVDVPNVYHRIITALLAVGIFEMLRRRGNPSAPFTGLVLGALALLYYLFSQEAIDGLRAGVASGRYAGAHFAAQGLASLLYLALLLRLALYAARAEALAPYRNLLAWALSAAAVLFLSVDAGHYYVLSGPGAQDGREAQYLRAALSILWGVCSFILMWLGMKHRARVLRIIALCLFGLTLFKLFLFDLRGMSEGGKIAAFILLGVLLLTISFMYQKLKKLLIDDKTV
ncbi:MAG: DUF2339 domain-containing protein [Chitinophagaceae bacterium]|nr:MAG: DUF2339 domain-containing protein [Chitinophagaceae bacterium]